MKIYVQRSDSKIAVVETDCALYSRLLFFISLFSTEMGNIYQLIYRMNEIYTFSTIE